MRKAPIIGLLLSIAAISSASALSLDDLRRSPNKTFICDSESAPPEYAVV